MSKQKGANYVMLSYNWSHQDLVKSVATVLKAAGIPYWIDVEQMSGNINEAMAAAVHDCAVIVPFMTEPYQKSINCKKELNLADMWKKPILPVMAQQFFDCDAWLAALTAGLLWVDFQNPSNYDNAAQHLIRAIKGVWPDCVKGPTSTIPSIVPSSGGSAPAASSSAPAASGGAKEISSFSEEDVVNMLKELKFESYAPTFQENGIDGRILMDLSENDLMNDLKVAKFHAKKIFNHVSDLKGKSKPADSKSAEPSKENKEEKKAPAKPRTLDEILPDGKKTTLRPMLAMEPEAVYKAQVTITRNGSDVSGELEWQLLSTSLPQLSGRVDEKAIETIEGTLDADNYCLEMAGTEVSDKTLIAADTYRLLVGPDGGLSGFAASSRGDWSAILSSLNSAPVLVDPFPAGQEVVFKKMFAQGADWEGDLIPRLTRTGNQVKGKFAWTMNGKQGIENVEGTYDPKARYLELEGISVSDPKLLGMDHYRLLISTAGDLSGVSSNYNKWDTKLVTVRV